jgi:hypothetical protein
MTTALKRLLAFLFAGVLLTACSGTKLSNSWSSQDYTGQIKNVYIIGIAKNEFNRMMFENLVNKRLAEEGIKSTQSYPDLPKDQEAGRETIIEKMLANDSDSVLLTRTIDQRTTATFSSGGTGYSYKTESPSRTPRIYDKTSFGDNSYYHNWINYYSTAFQAIPASSTNTKFVVLTVETVLYDLKSEKLIWMGRMEIDLEKNLNSMMKKSIDEAVKELKAQGFI